MAAEEDINITGVKDGIECCIGLCLHVPILVNQGNHPRSDPTINCGKVSLHECKLVCEKLCATAVGI